MNFITLNNSTWLHYFYYPRKFLNFWLRIGIIVMSPNLIFFFVAQNFVLNSCKSFLISTSFRLKTWFLVILESKLRGWMKKCVCVCERERWCLSTSASDGYGDCIFHVWVLWNLISDCFCGSLSLPLSLPLFLPLSPSSSLPLPSSI